jgi:hypothetical protein
MAGFNDISKSVGDFVNEHKDQIDDVVHSEQAEGVSDDILDGVAGFANNASGGKFEAQIDGARDVADKQVGNE